MLTTEKALLARPSVKYFAVESSVRFAVVNGSRVIVAERESLVARNTVNLPLVLSKSTLSTPATAARPTLSTKPDELTVIIGI